MIPRVGDADGPAARLLWRVAKAKNTAAGCGDERIAKTSCAENLDHAIDGVALAYSPGIDLDTGTIEAHGSLPCVQLHVPVSHEFECLTDLVGRWNLTGSAGKAPGAHERADSQIKGAFALAAILDAIGQEKEQLRRDGDRMRGRFTIDTTPLAGGLVIREQRVQTVDFHKRCIDGVVHGRAIRAIEDDGKRRAHGIRAFFQLFERLRSGDSRTRLKPRAYRGQCQNRCEQGEEPAPQETPFGVWFFQKAS